MSGFLILSGFCVWGIKGAFGLIRSSKASGAFCEGQHINGSSVSVSRELLYLICKLYLADRFPPVPIISHCVISQDVPTPRPEP